MGKRIISQRRGRGTSTYRSPSHRYKGRAAHKTFSNETNETKGKVNFLLHCPGHSAPLMEVLYRDGERILTIAPEGIREKQTVITGTKSELDKGNTLQLKDIPTGTNVFNVEKNPGDGGKIIRAAGTTAKVFAKLDNHIIILLPSKKKIKINKNCRATIGTVAGSGKGEKPFVKAGKRYHAMKARNRLYPRTSGVAMNAVDHPFGSGRGRHIGKSKSPSRFAPPGRKVGLIRARRVGKKK